MTALRGRLAMKATTCRKTISISIICLGILAGSAFGQGELRFCLRSEPKTFDPLKVEDDASVAIRYLTGGVLVSGNSFGGSSSLNAVLLANMSGLTISDGSVTGSNVILNGLENASNNGLHLASVTNTTVNGLNVSWFSEGVSGTGLLVDGLSKCRGGVKTAGYTA